MNKFCNLNKKAFTAFTLAEVLITLGIIGVVATLVIPPLIKNYQKMTYVAGLKKAYSEFQQGMKLYIADQGVTDLSQTDLFAKDDMIFDYDKFDRVIRKYFKVVKSCKNTDVSCSVKGTYLNYSGWDPNYEFGTPTSNGVYYNFFTVDGAGFQIWPFGHNSCEPDYLVFGALKGFCGDVEIDINGAKPPNKMGRDYFEFELGPDGNLYPIGGIAWAQQAQYSYGGDWQNSTWYWRYDKPWSCGNPGSSTLPYKTNGDSCAARIMENGWVMDY